MNPVRPGRRSLGRGRQARFDKDRQTAATHTQHVQLIGTEAELSGLHHKPDMLYWR
jgi:hypothetical protein